jgi:hypothetical protein
MLAGLASTANAAPTGPVVISLGNNTYSVTVGSNSIFYRKMDTLKAEAMDAAAKFCTNNGKQMKVLSVAEDPSIVLLGFISVKITFKALDASDPDLTAPSPSEAAGKQAPNDDFYSVLLKLDDLHKKGIITDEEFETTRKKILSHVN